ncbi:MAG: succinate--CoA ligase subunit alpha [bacterium]|nr:succinate--CoA ligase subunit alpha [bacterium]
MLLSNNTKVLVQGITGSAGSFHTKKCLEYGTKILAGVSPNKAKEKVHGINVFNTVKDALKEYPDINTSLIFVPAPFAKDAIIEATENRIRLIVCITEGIPIKDTLEAKAACKINNSILIGPNCPGILKPDVAKVGIMPGYIHKKGSIGVVSRSGTLTYEAVYQITKSGLGESEVIGIGGDPFPGTNFIEVLNMFENDPETKYILLIGEIGGIMEEAAAEFIKSMKKKVFAFIAGKTAPVGKRMGHAGAIIEGKYGTYDSKIKALEMANCIIIPSPDKIGEVIKNNVL